MAELTIRLIVDPESGKKNIVIGYDSDRAALPMEHEEDHRRWVEKILEATGLGHEEVGEIIVEREGAAAGAGSETAAEGAEQQEQQAQEEQQAQPQPLEEDQ